MCLGALEYTDGPLDQDYSGDGHDADLRAGDGYGRDQISIDCLVHRESHNRYHEEDRGAHGQEAQQDEHCSKDVVGGSDGQGCKLQGTLLSKGGV